MNPVRPDDEAFDTLLARAFPPPEVPAGFQARLAAATAREHARAGGAQELAAEHDAALRDLRKGYLRVRRETLLTLVAAAFTVGAAASALLPPLAAAAGVSVTLLGTTVAGVAALAGAAWVLLGDRINPLA